MRYLTFIAFLLLILVFSAQLLPAAPVVSRLADTNGSISVFGYTRNFVYAVSANAAPQAGRPLVIHLHGDGGNMGLSAAWKNAVLNDANGAVLLSAQGRNNIPAACNIDCSGWRFRMDETTKPYDDIDFINVLIDKATSDDAFLGAHINPNQVYAVGESRGAGFAYYLYADPRTRNKLRAIVPLSGTFYCDGGAQPNGQPTPGSDLTCGEVQGGYWGPKPTLFTAAGGVTRAAHILDVHGQLPPNGNELPETAPPALDVDYGSTTWSGWGDAAGCYTVRVSSQTEQTLPNPIGGLTVKSYAYSVAANNLATRCAALDLTFYIAQGGGHVPGGFEPTAWCFLSTVGGNPSSNACGLPPASTNTPTATSTNTSTPTNTPTATPTTPSGSGVSLSVNVAANRKPIDPNIYGLNFAKSAFASEISLPVLRWGGNLTTRYNWQTNNTNHAKDWFFHNNVHYDAYTGNTQTADQWVTQNKNSGTDSLITIPMIGYVAKNGDQNTCGFSIAKYGAQDANDAVDGYPDCGNGYAGGVPINNDPLDTSIVVTQSLASGWVDHLKTTFGAANNGGVRYYGLDNEPGIWNDTHRDVHRAGLTYDESYTRSVAYANAIKSIDPAALILGPDQDGWTRYWYASYVSQAQADADRNAHGGMAFVPWYLTQMKNYQQVNGVRLLDYLDLHFYPQNHVDLTTAGNTITQTLRLRSTRALWDATYVDESWIAQAGPDNGIVRLIPRMHDWVNNNYPNTKLALTEYNWGGLEHINGALAQADILGIFGREGLDMANLWNYPDVKLQTDNFETLPGAYAFRLYRNYDGAGAKFGDTSVSATSTDEGRLSIYAAQRSSDSSLTLMIINKAMTTSITANVSIAGFSSASSAQVYRYSDASLNAIVHLPDQAVSGNAFSAMFPANSITLVRLTAGPALDQKTYLPAVVR